MVPLSLLLPFVALTVKVASPPANFFGTVTVSVALAPLPFSFRVIPLVVGFLVIFQLIFAPSGGSLLSVRVVAAEAFYVRCAQTDVRIALNLRCFIADD